MICNPCETVVQPSQRGHDPQVDRHWSTDSGHSWPEPATLGIKLISVVCSALQHGSEVRLRHSGRAHRSHQQTKAEYKKLGLQCVEQHEKELVDQVCPTEMPAQCRSGEPWAILAGRVLTKLYWKPPSLDRGQLTKLTQYWGGNVSDICYYEKKASRRKVLITRLHKSTYVIWEPISKCVCRTV